MGCQWFLAVFYSDLTAKHGDFTKKNGGTMMIH
jgi:hypothetical protein